MARRSLRPHLNQIRGWVRQGRTDAWIAHQLEVTVQQIEAFKKENDLVADGDSGAASYAGSAGVDFDDEIDLRAEDDALIAAELEAAEAARAEEDARRAAEEAEAEAEAEPGDEDEDDDEPKKRRRGRRGGRGRRTGSARELEGTFDHGEEGYGLWLDPAVEDNPAFARALEFERRLRRAACERSIEHPLGEAFFDDALRSVWVLNMLVVDADTDAAGLMSALDELYGHLPHRRTFVQRPDVGTRLAPAMRAAGWLVEHDVYSVLRRERDRPAAAELAREVDEPTARAVE